MTRAALALLLAIVPLRVNPALVQVVAPKGRFSERIVLVLDRSGSMNGHLRDALAVVREVTRQPVERLHLKVVAFGGVAKERPWVTLPDKQAMERAETWLATVNVGSETLLCPALSLALRPGHPSLTVLVVSDGEFHSENLERDLLPRLRALQGRRLEAKLGRAMVCFVGVGKVGAAAGKGMTAMGKLGGGGYYRWTR